MATGIEDFKKGLDFSWPNDPSIAPNHVSWTAPPGSEVVHHLWILAGEVRQREEDSGLDSLLVRSSRAPLMKMFILQNMREISQINSVEAISPMWLGRSYTSV